jgi:hypothetical protein
MSAESALFVRSWRVGPRTVTLTMPRVTRGKVRATSIEWAPDRPAKLTAAEWAAYRAGRNAALAELAQHVGGRVALVEF